MEHYKQEFAKLLADSGALFFDDGLFLKDGRPSPYFVNMGTFNTGRLNSELGKAYAAMIIQNRPEVDVLFGPSYKGSAIANSTAIALWQDHEIDLPFEYDRKEVKAHGDAKTAKQFVNGTFYDGARILILDDVATSMDTKYEAVKKIFHEADFNNWDVSISGVYIGVDREQKAPLYYKQIPDSQGAELIAWKREHVATQADYYEAGYDAKEEFTQQTKIPVASIVGIRETLGFLHEKEIPVRIRGEKRPLDQQVMQDFQEYMQIYGVEND